MTEDEIIRLFREVDPFGPLHLVVCDGNVEDDHIDYCLEGPDASDTERAFGLALKNLEVSRREHLWFKAWGY